MGKLYSLFSIITGIGDFCQNNTHREEKIYIYLGLFSIITTFANSWFLNRDLEEQYIYVLNLIYCSVVFISSLLILYPTWTGKFKNKIFIAVLWNIAIFYNLICSNALITIISQFNQLQVTILITAFIIVAMLIRWQLAILIITIGTVISCYIDKLYIHTGALSDINGLQLKIIQQLFFINIVIITFIRPKQNENNLLKEKLNHLSLTMEDQTIELEKALKLKQEFLNNLEHEGHTPITSIAGIGEALWSNYEQLNSKQIYSGLEVIAKSSNRLLIMVNNLIDVSKLSSMSYLLNKSKVNLSKLTLERAEFCKKLYLNNKPLDFIYQIEANIRLECDLHYLTLVLDNLVINAIKYSNQGNITITLKYESEIEFTISDEGIALPKEELISSFEPFTVGSRTRTKSGDIPNGQRGVGLALCKLAIKLHGGKIWAESDGIKGTSFIFTLPK